MGVIVVEVDIARAPRAVFEYLTDYANEAKWQTNVSAAEVDPPGPVKVGTKVRKVRRTGAGVQSFTTEITALDEPALKWSDRVANGSFRGTTGEWSIAPAGNGSRVTLVATMRGTGLFRLLMPIVDRSARKDLREEFANLKRVLEAN